MRGRTCYVVGSVLYVVTGGVHALTHMQPPSADPAHVAALEAMRKATIPMAGLTPNLEDALNCLGWYMTTLSVLVGLLGLSLRGRCRTDVWLLRRTSLLMALGAGVLAFVAFRYHVAPPGILYGITAILFAAAMVRAKAVA
jgi:hypothetical protein